MPEGIEIDMHLHAETDLAVRVSDDGEDKHAVWVPRSQVEIEPKKGSRVVVKMPVWLAEREGLV